MLWFLKQNNYYQTDKNKNINHQVPTKIFLKF